MGDENITLKAPTNSPQEHPKRPEVAPKGSKTEPKRSTTAAGRFQDHPQQGSVLKGVENTTLKAPKIGLGAPRLVHVPSKGVEFPSSSARSKV